jgi:hypothetical protein
MIVRKVGHFVILVGKFSEPKHQTTKAFADYWQGMCVVNGYGVAYLRAA